MTASVVARLDLRTVKVGNSVVLGAVALCIAKGETIALQGPSGVGKTTLLRVLGGLETGFEGVCDVCHDTAIVFQEPLLLPWRRARDNLMIATGCSVEKANDLLAEVGLGDKGSAFPGQLSLGQQRRLALARGLAMAPALLLLDEPFVSLDPALVDEMLELVCAVQARRDMATLLVTHAQAEAEALATRIVTLGGSPATIQSDKANTPRLHLRHS